MAKTKISDPEAKKKLEAVYNRKIAEEDSWLVRDLGKLDAAEKQAIIKQCFMERKRCLK